MHQNNCLNKPQQQTTPDETGKSFDPGYLAAKKSIDDRALNHHVLETLRQALPHTADNAPMRIIELGAGIGTMFERLVDKGLLIGPSTYLATDMDPRQLKAAEKHLTHWAKKHDHSLSWAGACGQLNSAKANISLSLQHASAEELAKRADSLGSLHLIIAHGVLDLIDFPTVLPQLLSQLTQTGLAYFTCNFDGETVFLPECAGDEEILRQYHGSMEARLAGASHTGRRLLTYLQTSGYNILAAGSSDWVIHPQKMRYSVDETFFLHAIVETVEKELARKNDAPDGLTTWALLRHQQIEAGQLSFLARHLDLLVQHHPSLP